MRGRVVTGVCVALFALATATAAENGPALPSGEGPGEWLAGDLHVHSCYSHDSWCGPSDDNTGVDEAYTAGLTVGQQFALAASRDLDYLAITDHDDIRSYADAGFGAEGVIPVRGYETSLRGHAQMLGAPRLYPAQDQSAEDVLGLRDALRADGGAFQINHPANGSTAFPDDADWAYAYDVPPDTVEVWNISRLWQPPMPSGSSNDDAVRYWEGWLDRGARVGATGGSDSHWASLSAAQGVGHPTTWVYATERSESGVLAGLRAGRTFISYLPPVYGGPRIFLEADGDRDGRFESMVGDVVAGGSRMRVRVEGAPGAFLRIVRDGGRTVVDGVRIASASHNHRFAAADGTRWLRAEIYVPDLTLQRRAACDGLLGGNTTYCRNALGVLAMTSAVFVDAN